jgi:hypothetical protein
MASASRVSHRGRFSDTDKRSRALALPVERSSRYPFPHFPFGLRGDRSGVTGRPIPQDPDNARVDSRIIPKEERSEYHGEQLQPSLVGPSGNDFPIIK